MSLAAAAARVPTNHGGVACGLKTLLESLPDEDRDWLDTELRGFRSATWISRVLATEGHRISSDTITKHRRGECTRCGTL